MLSQKQFHDNLTNVTLAFALLYIDSGACERESRVLVPPCVNGRKIWFKLPLLELIDEDSLLPAHFTHCTFISDGHSSRITFLRQLRLNG